MAIYKKALISYLSNFNQDSQLNLIRSLKKELLYIESLLTEADELSDSVIHKIIGIFKYIHIDDAAFYEKDKNAAHFKHMLENLLISLNGLTLPQQEECCEDTL